LKRTLKREFKSSETARREAGDATWMPFRFSVSGGARGAGHICCEAVGWYYEALTGACIFERALSYDQLIGSLILRD